MRRSVLVLLALLVPAALAAQKQCKKGIPCGGSCISATKTCRIGAAAAAKTPVPNATAAQTTRPVAGPPATGVASSGASNGAWVASSRGHTYYRAGCAGGNKLAVANRVYFKSEADAKAAGMTRSRQKGC